MQKVYSTIIHLRVTRGNRIKDGVILGELGNGLVADDFFKKQGGERESLSLSNMELSTVR